VADHETAIPGRAAVGAPVSTGKWTKY